MRLTSTGGARNIKPSAQESNPQVADQPSGKSAAFKDPALLKLNYLHRLKRLDASQGVAEKEKRAGFRAGAFKEKRKKSVATDVVPVDPNPVVMMPSVVSRNPDPSIAMAPVIRAVGIVGPIPDFDIDSCRFRSGHRSKRACAEQNAQQDHQISFHNVFSVPLRFDAKCASPIQGLIWYS